MKEIWNKMSNEKMIGVLHAFVLLKPIINKTMTASSLMESSIDFLHSHGFNTH